MLDFVRRNDNFYLRSNLAGHLTGSAWILNPARTQVLLLHHKKLDAWLQPGGHADDTDADLCYTAWREAREECGLEHLQAIQPGIFDLDIHPIPEKGQEPQHLHYDVRFAFVAEAASLEIFNTEETLGLRWLPVQKLLQTESRRSIVRMLEKS